ncbi:methylated-DNA--[protein]-cysteine S-methyltransferase [Arcobacteraceae bacterium]|nr:methylated-DNA--[protein]-cysteine S-methyltransferase [Arcobacteraceae bacterium]
MNQINIQYYKKNGIELIMGSYDRKLCLLDYVYRAKRDTIDNRIQKALKAKYIECDDEILKVTRKQLDEYFEMKRKEFNIPLLMVGSDFQKSVWQALLDIPYGQTSSYKNQAITIGNEKGVRAVANANGANAIAIIIPCHRIIGSNGELTGYAGGLPLKKKLLELENNLFTI